MTTYLFLHGCPGSARDFEPLLAHAPEGTACRALDLPDMGAGPDDLRDDYAATFDAVRRAVAASADPVVLVGHSLGGWIAAYLAPELAARVERLVLLAALPGLTREAAEGYIGLATGLHDGALTVDGVVQIAISSLLAPPPPPELVARVEALVRSQSPARLARAFARVRLLAEAEYHVKRIDHRTDLVHMRDDGAVPLAASEALSRMASDARLHVLEGGGHDPHWTNTAEVARIVFGERP